MRARAGSMGRSWLQWKQPSPAPCAPRTAPAVASASAFTSLLLAGEGRLDVGRPLALGHPALQAPEPALGHQFQLPVVVQADRGLGAPAVVAGFGAQLDI